jgi:glycosyltransferase involved in cell wall biosynthesis
VLLSTYNRLSASKNAVETVLHQTLIPDEIFVIEDGSDSGIKDWLEKKESVQVQYIRVTENMGLSHCRNIA